MSIEVSNLVKAYGSQRAVNDLTFRVNRGEIVGFLGPNGAGKSTTMKMITGYLQPDAGTVRVCGLDVQQNPVAVRQKIGYLPESNALYSDLYVREYLGFLAELHRLPQRRAAVEWAIETVGLKPEANKKIHQLSKGYKQRVGIAAALLHDPEVLILDEPTSGLDPNQIIEIREVIRRQGANKTVLFSSHILQEVEAICDRVLIINKGGLVANDLLSNLQQAGHNQTVQVRFRESLEPAWLERLPGVQQVYASSPRQWELTCSDPEAVRQALLRLALEQQLNIEALQSGSNSLEEIFRQLTAAPAESPL
ncbi:MAG TPA: ATP-binding cassette domain-containing protein [Lacibacter sp.]|nr:ATP-binding cassette domain-containing protein [Lacibacter sp.]HMO88146.1 ATP-binding cassette domain-containing protein [Lacibacter sp.]HMP86003.1 ATP-binding cassette domain-containing protein [Lacibacter sp.]